MTRPERPHRPGVPLPPWNAASGLPPDGGNGHSPDAQPYPVARGYRIGGGAALPPPPPPPPPPPSRPVRTRDARRGWQLLAVFAFAEVVFLASSVLVVLPFALDRPALSSDEPLPPTALAAALIVPTVLAALVAAGGVLLVGSGRLRERLANGLSARWRGSDIGVGLALGGAGIIVTLPASAIWARWVGQDQANSAVGEVFDGQRLPLSIGIVVFLAVWLVAPLCEEVLYRGVLWRATEQWGWNRWVSFTVTTLVFAFAHLELLRTPLLVVISIPIALARVLTGNVLASIVAHQVNNFLPAIGLLMVTQGLLTP